MPKTIVGRFATQAAAQQVAHELETLVPEPREIQVVEEGPLRDQHAAGADEGFWDRLLDEVRAATANEPAPPGVARVYVIVSTEPESGALVRDLMAQSGATQVEDYITRLAA